MRIAILALIALVYLGGSVQIFHMTLSEALFITDNIYVARITGMLHMPMDYMDRIEYYLEVIDVVSGEELPEEDLYLIYSMMLPMCAIDEEGNEIWESPLVTGSGCEFSVCEGDTVIVFTGPLGTDSTVTGSVVRMEPMDSMSEILRILEEEFSN
jgi:hypothetical protein